ncbi:MAG: endoglucanase, partial [Mucilaginibacter sp.]|nr:endoglucanase [Mucilaginibacter sp.]
MKKVTGIFLFSVLFNTALFAQAIKTPVVINGALRVENGKIINKNGIEPQLRGISFSWSLWQGRKYYNPAVVNWLASDFKASLIRASMGVQPDHGYLQEPALQKQLIVNVVDQAIKEGIYVLIDWHDHHSNQHLTQSKEFFAEMSKRYAGVPNVIYEIWNEPEAISWDTVRNYAIQVIGTIRKNDTANLIIVGSPHWDQDVDVVANNPIEGFKNIA